MKKTALILAAALLWDIAASGQIANITPSRQGIAYAASAKVVTAAYTATKEDHTILADATVAAFTITLPAPSTKVYPFVVIKKIDSGGNAITIDPAGSATIDGSATATLAAQYQTIILHANATGWHMLGNPGSTTNSGTYTQTSASAAAFASGPNGNTNPVFRLVNNVSSAATGLSVTGRAAAAGADLTVLSSGTNEGLRLEAKGSGTILLNETATGAVLVGDATTPALSVVHTTEGTGWGITSAAAASGAALAVISSGTNENGTLDAKGSGTLTLNGTATGNIVLARAASASSTLAVTGAITPTGGVAAAGGFSVSPRLVHSGAAPAQASTDGTELDAVVTELYVAEVFIPANCTVTGMSVMWGTNTNGNAKVMLFDDDGDRLAISATTDVSGHTADAYSTRIAFSAPLAVKGPATYYIGVMADDNTHDINTHTMGNFGAGKITGLVYATEAGYLDITPPTTFTTGLGPIATLY